MDTSSVVKVEKYVGEGASQIMTSVASAGFGWATKRDGMSEQRELQLDLLIIFVSFYKIKQVEQMLAIINIMW